jgi:hypothetical protein
MYLDLLVFTSQSLWQPGCRFFKSNFPIIGTRIEPTFSYILLYCKLGKLTTMH